MRTRFTAMAMATLVVSLAACTSAVSPPRPGASSGGPGAPSVAPSAPTSAPPAPTPARSSSSPTSPAAASGAPSAVAAVAGGGSVKAIDVCSKLTRSEVGSAIGTAVKPGETMELTTETAGCQWDAADNSLRFLQVYVAAYTQELWDIDLAKPGTETVPHVGDAAIRTEIGLMGPAGTLVIRKGALRVDLEIYAETGSRSAVAAEQLKLADLILARL